MDSSSFTQLSYRGRPDHDMGAVGVLSAAISPRMLMLG
jgi:hypothetical protein